MLLNNPVLPEPRPAEPATLFYRIRVHPFEAAPSPPGVYLDGGRRRLIASITAGVGGGGELVVVRGDRGSGKTSLLLALADAVSATNGAALLCAQGIYPCRADTTFDEILSSCQVSLCFPDVAAFLRASGHRTSRNANGRVVSTVLLLDDADRLEPAVVKRLVRLHQTLLAKGASLTTVMAAAEVPPAAQTAAMQTAAAAATRVVTLEPFGPDDIGPFIAHRLAAAGHVGSNPFSADACRRIAELSQGRPDVLTRLCGRSFDLSLREHSFPILPSVVDEAAMTLSEPALGQQDRKLSYAPVPPMVGAVASVVPEAPAERDEATSTLGGVARPMEDAPAAEAAAADRGRRHRTMAIALASAAVALVLAVTLAVRVVDFDLQRSVTAAVDGMAAHPVAERSPRRTAGDGAVERRAAGEAAGVAAPDAAPYAAPYAAPSTTAAGAGTGRDGAPADLPLSAAAAPAVGPASPASSPIPVADLLQRGDALLAISDVSSAQPFYRLAAELGSGQAAMKLAMTMDPVLLRERDARVKRARPDEALSWYDRAAALGERNAAAHRARLQDWLRTRTSDAPDDR